ncbi:META domain-containing protein [Rathayibacter sp. VKM Ac-2760]|uniref:META domain-containing protein n=1 Tax=Rathayibacter sp. VKM Ac-2760 TaxID=2609253 RepID=UPI0013172E31|nr:META domain-containing protein [Rathayibacter sp. VKM Ac-2760]QHC58694.1 META domain-containing protein [Rathayibacter sp. VKM Ac-2760]
MSHRRHLAVLLLACAVAVGLTACTSEEKEPLPTVTSVQELDLGTYRSTSLSSTSEHEFTNPSDSLTMSIDDDGDRMYVDTPCNTIGGAFDLSDSVIAISNITTTLAVCIPPGETLDRWVERILSDPLTVTRSGTDLTFRNSWGEMVFTPDE